MDDIYVTLLCPFYSLSSIIVVVADIGLRTIFLQYNCWLTVYTILLLLYMFSFISFFISLRNHVFKLILRRFWFIFQEILIRVEVDEAEGDEVNLEMEEIAEESNIRFEHLPKGLIK